MGRLQRFREIRYNKRKHLLSIMIFLVLLILGIYIADHSVYNLIEGKEGMGIVAFKNTGPYIEVNFMNCRLFLNTGRIARDYQMIKEYIARILS